MTTARSMLKGFKPCPRLAGEGLYGIAVTSGPAVMARVVW